jgi:hypothetical protein
VGTRLGGRDRRLSGAARNRSDQHLGEIDDDGANHRAAERCSVRWMRSARKVFVIAPLSAGDLADIWREFA